VASWAKAGRANRATRGAMRMGFSVGLGGQKEAAWVSQRANGGCDFGLKDVYGMVLKEILA